MKSYEIAGQVGRLLAAAEGEKDFAELTKDDKWLVLRVAASVYEQTIAVASTNELIRRGLESVMKKG